MSDPLDLPDPGDPAENADPSADPSADLSAEAVAKAEALAKAEAPAPAQDDGPFPWDADPPPDDPDAPRRRHDAFTEAKKCVFLRALVKTGCILDACRLAGIGPRTIYRHQEGSPTFFDNCRAALRMSATPVELTAWQRAVEGVEQEYAVGGEVRVRTRYSEGLLRLLLQGSNPKKYGPNPGFRRKRLLKWERKQMEREIRAEIRMEVNSKGPPERSFDEAVQSVLAKIEAIERHGEPKKRAAGWTKSPDGHWVPPGYAPIPGWTPPAAEGGPGAETPRDSV